MQAARLSRATQPAARGAARPAAALRPSRRSAPRILASAAGGQQAARLAAASAAAALLLAASTPSPTLAASPRALLAEQGESGQPGLVTRLLDRLPSNFPRVDEDPFGADRKQEKTVGDTKRPIDIPTEQQAVAPEAFPNPSQDISPRPPVLAQAEGDEHLGENAGQFADLDESGRQALIDKASPAQASRSSF